MGESVDVGTGITIVFGTSTFSCEITDIRFPKLSREAIDVTHQGTSKAKEYVPADFYDAGEFDFDFHFNPATSPPIDEATEEVTFTFPDGDEWVCNAFMTGYEATGPLNDKMTGTATFKVDGGIAIDEGGGSGSGADI